MQLDRSDLQVHYGYPAKILRDELNAGQMCGQEMRARREDKGVHGKSPFSDG